MAQNRNPPRKRYVPFFVISAKTPIVKVSRVPPFASFKALGVSDAGLRQDPKVAINGALFTEEDYQEMILCRDLDFYSLCEHHLLPFYRQGACRLPAQPAHRRAVEDRADGRDLRAAAAGPGAADDADCPHDNGGDRAAGRRRGARSRASVYADARGREAELVRHDFGDARRSSAHIRRPARSS